MIPTLELSPARDNRKPELKPVRERCGCNKFFGLILITTSVSAVHKTFPLLTTAAAAAGGTSFLAAKDGVLL
uniref:Uncharacterized protein n=1 Tax=Romanomermis culicivorax TaxID=13658 RepID=A0A915KMZ9_ROMCU